MSFKIGEPLKELPQGIVRRCGGYAKYTALRESIHEAKGQWVPVATESPARALQIRAAICQKRRGLYLTCISGSTVYICLRPKEST